MNNPDNLYRQAIEKWGIDSQLDMAIEECSEVIQAIIHFRRRRCGLDKVIEEIVDISLCVEQLKQLNPEAWEHFRKIKLDRLESLLNPDIPPHSDDDEKELA